MKIYLGLCFNLMLAVAAHAEKTLLEATYRAEHSGLTLRLTRRLVQNDDRTFSYSLNGKGKLVRIKEHSLFTREATTLRPLDYTYKRRIFGVGRTEQVKFDWANNTATYTKKKSKTVNHHLQAGVMDSALYQLKLQMDMYAGKPNKLLYHYIQKDRLRTREFRSSGEGDYQLEGKTYKTETLTRLEAHSRKKTEITLIPALFYQIAEIKQTQKNGKVYKTLLTKLTYDKDLMAKFYSGAKI